jgi:peptidoglycan/LPS O-acetylase OafA/YrhL|tara:strand:+ start:813 stop:1220 length:408 start_codon:yes stop_codon:yes gene_type:complete
LCGVCILNNENSRGKVQIVATGSTTGSKKMKTNMATGVVLLATLTGLAAIVGILIYAFQNDSGHTGFDPYTTLVVFVPVVLAGILRLVMQRGNTAARWCALCAVLVGITGVVLLVYLDQSNTLLQYEVWIQRGMP